ncbi:LOW QUALITY PROTEIN: pectin lyase fold/virulence factor [Fusarium acuminatum]|uniref:Pectin lyase fold/virulence factor n=1 Tax=Fusarium acuminatum TaxID=5515 RepID=A0ABZ2X320_9HYPO
MNLLLLAFYLSTVHLSGAANVYVDINGIDSNSGSADKPVKSIKKAQELVRELIPSAEDDITVHIGPGTWVVDAPIVFTTEDSGINGITVTWSGSETIISGGLNIRDWVKGEDGIWSASVPAGTMSRNLFVNGFAAQYARRQIQNREEFNYTEVGMSWSSPKYDWIMKTPGIEKGELRAINSFTDRIALIEAVGDHVLEMKSQIWANQIIGYDQIAKPFWDGGLWIQNVKALLTDGGQFYLDRDESVLYYQPLEGEDMATASAYLGIEEVLMVVGGTYEDPIHDLRFEGITFEHSTWLKPDTYGYIDQQTGGHMGNGSLWPEFEASRPYWWQMPSAIQISAAYNISMESCTFRELGAGGIGVGNDKNAHFTGIGLGASNIHISDNYFTQVMGNSITVGDEASRNITWFNNLGFTSGKYYSPNDWIPEQQTGLYDPYAPAKALTEPGNTVIDNWGKLGVEGNEVLDGFPNFSGRRNNTFLRNYLAPAVNGTSLVAQRAAFRAGVIPSKREARPVTNSPNIADSYLDVQVGGGRVVVNVTNFDDVDFTDVVFRISGPGVVFEEESIPDSIPADGSAAAVYTVSGSQEGNSTARVDYVNPRTRPSSREKEFSLPI